MQLGKGTRIHTKVGVNLNNSWDERYSTEEFIYGTEPNQFFAEQLQKLKPSNILLLGEGEGRNAVHAAKLGWQVDAVDFSKEAKMKAEKLASFNNVKINYTVEDLINFSPTTFYDCAALIFLHLKPEIRIQIHSKVIAALKPNGLLILEAFSEDQLKYNSGGPKNPELLYNLEMIFEDFQDFEIIKFSKEVVLLTEGIYHQGAASVIGYAGIRK